MNCVSSQRWLAAFRTMDSAKRCFFLFLCDEAGGEIDERCKGDGALKIVFSFTLKPLNTQEEQKGSRSDYVSNPGLSLRR